METFFYVLDERLSILMADDDPITREFASVYLSSPVAEVHTVSDGQAALAKLSEASFDVLLLDLDMPVLSGFETLECLRAEATTRELPVIVISGREDIASIDRAYKLGATSFVTKPVNWRLLTYQIKYVLRASRGEFTPADGGSTR